MSSQARVGVLDGGGLDTAGCLAVLRYVGGQVPAVLAGGVRDHGGGQVPGLVRVFVELAPRPGVPPGRDEQRLALEATANLTPQQIAVTVRAARGGFAATRRTGPATVRNCGADII